MGSMQTTALHCRAPQFWASALTARLWPRCWANPPMTSSGLPPTIWSNRMGRSSCLRMRSFTMRLRQPAEEPSRRAAPGAADHYAALDPGLRAVHLDRAGDPQAARAYLEAARREAAEYRYAAAQALGRRGLELASEREERFALASLLGEVLHDLGDMPAALASCQEALNAAGSDAERCRALLGVAAVKRVTDDIDGALADLVAAEAIAETHGLTHELARLHLLRGNLYFPSGDIERCLREHGRSLELAERTGSAELAAAALGGLGDGEYMRGRMMSARDRFARCVKLCQDHGLVRIEVAHRPMLAFTSWFAGDGVKAAAEAALAIEMAQRVAHHRAEMIGRHAACFIGLCPYGRL